MKEDMIKFQSLIASRENFRKMYFNKEERSFILYLVTHGEQFNLTFTEEEKDFIINNTAETKEELSEQYVRKFLPDKSDQLP